MQTAWRGPLLLIVAALVVVGALYAWSRLTMPQSMVDAYSTTNATTYDNASYGYSLVIPGGYEAREIEPIFVQVGQGQGVSFSEVADVATLYATVQESIPTFAAFEKLSAQLACSSSGASSVGCGQVATSSRFTASSGVTGTELYFDSDRGERGPFYAFDVTENVPNASYAVLLIYPPSPLAGDNADRALLQQLATSLQVATK